MTSKKTHLIYLSLLSLSLAGNFFSLRAPESPVARAPASEDVEDSRLLGHLEEVHVGENRELHFFAKIDTGAESSSIHAENIEPFHKLIDGRAVLYVRFETTDEEFRSQVFERPVVKIGDVKSALGLSKRYFIREKIWIGDDAHYVNVTLADRSHLKRKFLVGKNILDEGYLINTALRTP